MTSIEADSSSDIAPAGEPSSHELKTANHVYILDPVDSWIPGQVVERSSSERVEVSIPEYKNQQAIQCDAGRSAKRKHRKSIDLTAYANHALPLQNVDANGRLNQVDDMVDLPFLHEVSRFLYVHILNNY
jgi:hypothetical protein